MDDNRILELLSPFLNAKGLSQFQLALVSTHLELLLEWNSKINLTAVRNPEEIVTRHFGESLFAAQQLFPDPGSAVTVIDVGSGPGFPGVPLKIWNPELTLTLVEANYKKAVFLREVVRRLGLKNVDVRSERAEGIDERAELVCLRAVEHFERTIGLARKLVQRAGRIALLIGTAQSQAAQSLLSDFVWQKAIAIPLSRNRALVVGTAPEKSL
jgi:16S rRNA (guanine527-N7)-methyltransferase